MRGCVRLEKRSYMLLWLALWWADWLALEDFSYSLFTEFYEVRQRFIADSSPVASVSALCNTAAGLRVLSPLYARRREVDGEDQRFGGAGGSRGSASGSGFVGADAGSDLADRTRPRRFIPTGFIPTGFEIHRLPVRKRLD